MGKTLKPRALGGIDKARRTRDLTRDIACCVGGSTGSPPLAPPLIHSPPLRLAAFDCYLILRYSCHPDVHFWRNFFFVSIFRENFDCS